MENGHNYVGGGTDEIILSAISTDGVLYKIENPLITNLITGMRILIKPNMNNLGNYIRIQINETSAHYVYQIDDTSPGMNYFVENEIYELMYNDPKWYLTGLDMGLKIKQNIEAKITSGTTDLTAGVSSLKNGSIYCVYVSTTTPKIWKAYVGVNGRAFLLFENEPKPVPLGLKKNALQSGTIYKTYEPFQLEGVGGSGEYTFKILSGFRPQGLAISTDGLVTFTDDDGNNIVPQKANGSNSGLYQNINIQITDKITKNTVAILTSLHILPPTVDFTATNTTQKYDGTLKKPTVTAKIRSDKELDIELVQDVDFTLKIGSTNENGAVGAGSYLIQVRMITDGYLVGNVTPNYFTITNN